jgi:hypoxanthine phosphoribosyltransferase
MLSHYLDCKMVGLDVSLRDNATGPESNIELPIEAMMGHRILIVDDINDSGATINWIVNDWENSVLSGDRVFPWGENVRFAVVIDNAASNATIQPHYTGETINKREKDEWIVFPYEEFWKGR